MHREPGDQRDERRLVDVAPGQMPAASQIVKFVAKKTVAIDAHKMKGKRKRGDSDEEARGRKSSAPERRTIGRKTIGRSMLGHGRVRYRGAGFARRIHTNSLPGFRAAAKPIPAVTARCAPTFPLQRSAPPHRGALELPAEPRVRKLRVWPTAPQGPLRPAWLWWRSECDRYWGNSCPGKACPAT